MTIDLGDGRQIIVSSDSRHEGIWIQICANRTSKGVQMEKKQAVQLRKALFECLYPKPLS